MKQVSDNKNSLRMERHRLHAMWSHTMRFLDSLKTRVNEGKDIQAASEFARWIQTAGVVAMFEDNPQPSPLLVDGYATRRACVDVLQTCADQWRNGAPRIVALAKVEELSLKVDVLAHAVAQLLPERARAEVTASPLPPALLLLESADSPQV